MIQLRGDLLFKTKQLCFIFFSIPILEKAMKKTLNFGFWMMTSNRSFPLNISESVVKSKLHTNNKLYI